MCDSSNWKTINPLLYVLTPFLFSCDLLDRSKSESASYKILYTEKSVEGKTLVGRFSSAVIGSRWEYSWYQWENRDGSRYGDSGILSYEIKSAIDDFKPFELYIKNEITHYKDSLKIGQSIIDSIIPCEILDNGINCEGLFRSPFYISDYVDRELVTLDTINKGIHFKRSDFSMDKTIVYLSNVGLLKFDSTRFSSCCPGGVSMRLRSYSSTDISMDLFNASK